MDGVKLKKELMKPHPQFGVYPCDLSPTQLPKCGEVIGRVMKRRLEVIHQKDVNVRQVELKPIIKEVAEEVVGIWQKASIPCWGVVYTAKHIEKMWGAKLKIGKSRKDLSEVTEKDMDKLFDISHRRQAPELQEDKMFLRDQQRKRNLHISPMLDRQTTVRWQRQQQRRQRSERGAGAAATAIDATAASVPDLGRRTSRSCDPSVGRSAVVFG